MSRGVGVARTTKALFGYPKRPARLFGTSCGAVSHPRLPEAHLGFAIALGISTYVYLSFIVREEDFVI